MKRSWFVRPALCPPVSVVVIFHPVFFEARGDPNPIFRITHVFSYSRDTLHVST